MFILLGNFGELCLYDSLEDDLEFILKDSDGRWDDMAKLFVEFRCLVKLGTHVCHGGKVLRIGLREVFERYCSLIVNRLVLMR